ncbi:MAG: hypothetical protein EP343_06640 [Deltaproteobacteria bacterium]|nr:MAG: hypothetical protein EP343_06640 [Deltaproteobacteria bacterium]
MARSKKRRDEQLLNPDGLKHYRRTYSGKELGWGLVILLILLSTAGWVVYRGAHPDPDLFSDKASLLKKGKKIKIYHRPLQRMDGISSGPSHGQAKSQKPKRSAADMMFPEGLVGDGWKRKSATRFSRKNLYEKINGRAGYFLAFGFKQMFFSTLLHPKSGKLIDLELYDMGNGSNALGTYSGELGKGANPKVSPQGISHLRRNAMFVSQGPYYLRAIGSDESKEVKDKLLQVQKLFQAKIKGEPLPWGYGFFIARMAIKPSKISYKPKNAFSFGFAKDVYVGQQGKNTFLFVKAEADPSTAKAMQEKFRQGFMSYGTEVKDPKGMVWVKDRYINTYATALAVNRWVVGIQGAAKWDKAQAAMERMKKAILAMPKAMQERAVPREKSAKPKPRPRKRAKPEPRSVKPSYPTERRTKPAPESKPSRPKPRGYESGIDER